MHIFLGENHTGKKIIEAFSSIPKYKTRTITQTEIFDKILGIVPGKVKIQMTSLCPKKYIENSNKHYYIIIVIDNIVLEGRYSSINMQINQLCDSGDVLNIKTINDNSKNKTKLAMEIETVIHQFLDNLDKIILTARLFD